MATLVSGSIFQISSCTVDNAGALSALANPQALSDLFATTRLGQLINGLGDSSVDIHIGEDE